MARKSRHMRCQDAVKITKNAPGVTKRESGHESIYQRLLRLKAKGKTMEKQEMESHG